MSCPYCHSGRIAVEPGSSQTYRCPDCDGTGRINTDTPDPRDCDDRDHLEINDSETKDT